MLKPPMFFIVFLGSGLTPIDPSLAAELQVTCRSIASWPHSAGRSLIVISALLSLALWRRMLEPDADTPAIFRDEFDACVLNGLGYSQLRGLPQLLTALVSDNGLCGDVRRACEVEHSPA